MGSILGLNNAIHECYSELDIGDLVNSWLLFPAKNLCLSIIWRERVKH